MDKITLFKKVAPWQAALVMGVVSTGISALMNWIFGGEVHPIGVIIPAVMAPTLTYTGYSLGRNVTLLIHEKSEELETLSRKLEAERKKSEELLLNVLPASVAQQLKQSPGLVVQEFEEATILFADLVGFTQLTSRLQPRQLLDLLNDIFSRFDKIANSLGVEKIKTIGDAYMVAAGVPEAVDDSAGLMARLGCAMIQETRQVHEEYGEQLDLRIGLHTGPVIAGVIGTRKFTYDVWGETVNHASRLESHGIPGKIHIAEETKRLLEGRFAIETRGLIPLKGIGKKQTYFFDRPIEG